MFKTMWILGIVKTDHQKRKGKKMKQSLFELFIKKASVQKLLSAGIDEYKHHQKLVSKVQPPKNELTAQYETLLADFAAMRGGSLWYPYLSSGLGNGAYVELLDGSVKLDFIAGIGAHWSHGDPDIIRASLEAAFQDTLQQGNLQQSIHCKKVFQQLQQLSGFDHAFISTSGAMAAENALKIAIHHQQPRKRILAFNKCFMGRTLSLAQITDKEIYRKGLLDNMGVDHIPFFDYKDPDGSIKKSVSRLKEAITRHSGKIAVMCMELIQGEGGYYPGTPEFFKAIIDILKNENILVLVDEIQTFGRTDKPFAFQHFGLEGLVDIVTVGKLSQVCATLYNKEIEPQSGIISQTFTSSSAAFAGASVIFDQLINGNYLGKTGKILTWSDAFREALSDLSQEMPDKLSGPFGYGAMCAFTPFDGDKNRAIAFVKKCFENGLIGFIAGDSPTRVRFLPPLGGVRDEDIQVAISIIRETLKEV